MAEKKRGNLVSTLVIVVLAVVLAVVVIFDAMQPRYTKTEKATIAMGTVVTQKLYSENDCSGTIEDIEAILTETENMISWRIDTSSVSQLNKNAKVQADDKLKDIIEKCNSVYTDSMGAFDITVGSLSTLWNIGEENAEVPSRSDIAKALSSVDGSQVKIDGDYVTIGNGQFVDLGAVGKGLACDYIREALAQSDVYGAVVLVGGSVLLYGQNPDADSWTVAVRNPRGESNETLGSFTITEGFVSTSGDYERVLTENGKSYHHILDSKTGYPAESSLMSVTVVCDNGLLSDALSTAAFVLGKEEGAQLLQKYGAEGIFIEKDYSIYVTEGLRNNFTLTDNSFTVEEAK